MKKYIALFLLTALCLSLCSCAPERKFSRSSFEYFDTQSVIIGYEKSEGEFQKWADKAFSLLEKYHRLFDIYYEYEGINNLCTVNKNAGISPVKVDSAIIELLLFSREIYEKTEGAANIAMGSVLSLWHDKREEAAKSPESARLPDRGELERLRAHTDINKMIIDEEASTVFLTDPEMSLDVGAVAKGFATERAAEMLSGAGKEGYALSIGGNVRCIGEKTDGEKWEVGVQNPDLSSDKAYIAKIEIADQSLVTSGTYQRYYTVNGKEYHHIIDPETLFPGENFASVSVLCEDSGVADALSTALFNMTEEAGRNLIASFENCEALWVYKNGDISMTDGFLN